MLNSNYVVFNGTSQSLKIEKIDDSNKLLSLYMNLNTYEYDTIKTDTNAVIEYLEKYTSISPIKDNIRSIYYPCIVSEEDAKYNENTNFIISSIIHSFNSSVNPNIYVIVTLSVGYSSYILNLFIGDTSYKKFDEYPAYRYIVLGDNTIPVTQDDFDILFNEMYITQRDSFAMLISGLTDTIPCINMSMDYEYQKKDTTVNNSNKKPYMLYGLNTINTDHDPVLLYIPISLHTFARELYVNISKTMEDVDDDMILPALTRVLQLLMSSLPSLYWDIKIDDNENVSTAD